MAPPVSAPPSSPIQAGLSGFVSVYSADVRVILKGYEVWENGRCTRRFDPIDDNKASLNVEEIVYLRHGLHPRILKFLGREIIADGVLPLKLKRAKGDFR